MFWMKARMPPLEIIRCKNPLSSENRIMIIRLTSRVAVSWTSVPATHVRSPIETGSVTANPVMAGRSSSSGSTVQALPSVDVWRVSDLLESEFLAHCSTRPFV